MKALDIFEYFLFIRLTKLAGLVFVYFKFISWVVKNFCVGVWVFWLFFVLLLFWVLLVLVFGCFVRGFIGVSWCFIGRFYG
jgi:hypothetical protein